MARSEVSDDRVNPAHQAGGTLRILDIVPSFRPAFSYGGPIESSYQLCRSLAELGCDVRVLTTNSNGIGRVTDVSLGADLELETGLTVRYCRKLARHSISPEMLRVLRRYVSWADIVHLTGTFNFPTFPTLLACRLLNKPLVWSPRGSLIIDWKGARRPGLKRAWCRAAQMVAPVGMVLHVTSEAERDASVRLLSARTLLVPNGVAIPATVAHAARADLLRLAYIGRLNPSKGIENLLDACASLAKEGFVFSLRIAGDGEKRYSDRLRVRVGELGLGSQVTFVGDVREKEKDAFFASADVLMVPSHVENFGIVVAEALAHEVPVIASRNAPWAEIERIECGLWVNNDPASLADAVHRISSMPLAEMGRRGRDWMAAEFTWRSQAHRMLNSFREMRNSQA